jgi:hypothetical protein
MIKKQKTMNKHLPCFIIVSSLLLLGLSANAQTQNGAGPTITKRVFGGGNEASVTGNVSIGMSAGNVNGDEGRGIYGGCNSTGHVSGNVAIDITGGTIGVDAENKANVHGGGYGQPTTVGGDIAINFGKVTYDESGTPPVEIHRDYPHLYGDLYGGSALGNVNTNSQGATIVDNIIDIHIDNGTIHGDVYGGGLGVKEGPNPVAAMVYGKVYVAVGGIGTDGVTYTGKASFDDCSIFGCNNLNGSPQDEVFVDVYQTNHTHTDSVDYMADDREYAIKYVFGGGNQSNYAPEGGSVTSEKVTYVHIWGCENTIERVYGGSNAADAISTNTVVDGGRFDYIFGGGNGLLKAANVGVNEHIHHTYSQIKGGIVGWCFGGSNRLGNCINIEQDLETEGECGALDIGYFFQGGNMADQYGELVLNFTCEERESYHSAYGGCRLGTVYGNITVNVTGGTIGKLYGGCQGDIDYAADVKRFPTQEELDAMILIQQDTLLELREYMATQLALGRDWRGRGGNITINVYGGAIGELFGGCDQNGNVEGRITVNVEDMENDCGLFIGNVYGASNHTPYNPLNPDGFYPKVNIIKAEIGGAHDGFNYLDGIQDDERFVGNVFGGGNKGDVTSNPKVIIGDGTDYSVVDVLGSVFGGGNEGSVTGSTEVVVVPDTHILTVNLPVISNNNNNQQGGGTIKVRNQAITGVYNLELGEYVDVGVLAIPEAATQDGGFVFDRWTINEAGANAGAYMGNDSLASTNVTMGLANATVTGSFKAVPAHTLTVQPVPDGAGTFTVEGVTYSNPIWVAETASVRVVATPVSNEYVFDHWSIDETGAAAGATVSNIYSSTTTFTMGTASATLTAHFKHVHTLTMTTEQTGVQFKVNGVYYQPGHPVSIPEGTTVTIQAIPSQGFVNWTCNEPTAVIENANLPFTRFTMGTGNAIVTAYYGRDGGSGSDSGSGRGRRANNNRNSRR